MESITRIISQLEQLIIGVLQSVGNILNAIPSQVLLLL